MARTHTHCFFNNGQQFAGRGRGRGDEEAKRWVFSGKLKLSNPLGFLEANINLSVLDLRITQVSRDVQSNRQPSAVVHRQLDPVNSRPWVLQMVKGCQVEFIENNYTSQHGPGFPKARLPCWPTRLASCRSREQWSLARRTRTYDGL